MIVFKTAMHCIPANCAECQMTACSLPVTLRDPAKIRKSCLAKRHPKCPLVEIQERGG